jgi:hypothetical protein
MSSDFAFNRASLAPSQGGGVSSHGSSLPLIRFSAWTRSIIRERSGQQSHPYSQVSGIALLSIPSTVAVVVSVHVEVEVLVFVMVEGKHPATVSHHYSATGHVGASRGNPLLTE